MTSTVSRTAPALVAALLISFASAAAPADTKIEKQVLGQAPANQPIEVSPAGQHVAWVAAAGSRMTVEVDGVAGPKVDEILSPNRQVAFSSDGAHSAWFGRVGGNYLLVVDGKVMAQGAYSSSTLPDRDIRFSPGGKHVYFIEADSTHGYRQVIDGKPGPWSGDGHLGIAFSRDGEHYAYNGQERMNRNVFFTMIDGSKQGFIGNDLKYTGDRRLISTTSAQDGATLLVDQKPVVKAAVIAQIWTAPTGSLFAAAVQEKTTDTPVLYLDGNPVADCVGPKNVEFSPDGKHYAAVCSSGTGRDYVVIDGKKGQEYLGINEVAFAPDSSRVMYISTSSQGKRFVVVDGREFGPYRHIIAWDPAARTPAGSTGLMMSRTGGHYLFAGELDPTGVDLVWDGKQVALSGYSLMYKPDLSDNGSRFGAAVSSPKSGAFGGLMIDGKVLTAVTPIRFGTWPGSGIFDYVCLSADGKHVAYAGKPKARRSKVTIFVDDKAILPDPKQRQLRFIAFTPDSQHVVWEGWASGRRGSGVNKLYIDGTPVLTFSSSPLDNLAGAWQMDAQGVLQFLAIGDDGSLLRYRVTPAADDGVQAMLAGGGS